MSPVEPTLALLVVDADDRLREPLVEYLAGRGFRVSAFRSPGEALAIFQPGSFHAAIIGLRSPDGDGLELLRLLRSEDPAMQALVVTGQGSIASAVCAMKLGAYDYLLEPCAPDQLETLVQKACSGPGPSFRAHALEGKVVRLSLQLKERVPIPALTGTSPAVQRLHERIEVVGRNRATVMVLGESGTGKELVARAIHHGGILADKAFVAINCAALPQELIESELFGYRKGAFTGATADSAGLFRAATGGTVLLDEITEMPSETQAKLLRVLEEHSFRPLGSTLEVPTDVRIIATSNRDLPEAVATGRLRQDLFYRLSVVTIMIPPLRERKEDIPSLVTTFIEQYSRGLGRFVSGVEPAALDCLLAHDWPGNVRELKNVIEAACIFGKSSLVTCDDLPRGLLAAGPTRSGAGQDPRTGIMTLAEGERMLIVRALRALRGNKTRAARALGISRKQFYVKLSVLGISPSEWTDGLPVRQPDRGTAQNPDDEISLTLDTPVRSGS